MNAQRLVELVSDLICRCTDDERTTYEALVEMSEGWRMRLEELKDEEEDNGD